MQSSANKYNQVQLNQVQSSTTKVQSNLTHSIKKAVAQAILQQNSPLVNKCYQVNQKVTMYSQAQPSAIKCNQVHPGTTSNKFKNVKLSSVKCNRINSNIQFLLEIKCIQNY